MLPNSSYVLEDGVAICSCEQKCSLLCGYSICCEQKWSSLVDLYTLLPENFSPHME